MHRHRGRRLIALASGTVIAFAVFLAWVEPSLRTWGTTPVERVQALPGDDIVPGAVAQETRAITIHAPIATVWSWLAQLGRDRDGFYSFDLLENIVGCAMPTRDELRPEWQHWKLGDKLWMYPENKAGGAGFATLRVYVPGSVLGFATRIPGSRLSDPETGSWTFVLQSIDAATTRLLVRGRAAKAGSLSWRLFDRLVFAPAHFVMERRTMLGLKQLAEESTRHRSVNHMHTILWIIVAGFALAALYLVLASTHWIRALVAYVAVLAAFQVLTLVQPPIGLAVLTTVVVGLLFIGTGSEKETDSFPRAAEHHGV